MKKKKVAKKPAYRRVLIKMSGEVMGGEQGYGICPEAVHGLADQIVAVHKLGVDVAVVIGGGNIFRGLQGYEARFSEFCRSFSQKFCKVHLFTFLYLMFVFFFFLSSS